MYSAYKLNKQCDNIQPWHTPFPIWNQSVVPCPVLTVTSWPAYRFLRILVRWSGIPISFHILFLENFQNFPQFLVIHTVKGSGIVKTEIDVFLELSCFSMVQQMLAVWFLVPLPLLKPAWPSGSLQFTYYWGLTCRILSITLLACEMSAVVRWTFFGVAFLWDWNENRPFPVLWPLLSFPNLLAFWVQHFYSSIF